ncbi:hypothetical protein BKA83DRAFT_4342163, partial [Pisolithus microcarpus]
MRFVSSLVFFVAPFITAVVGAAAGPNNSGLDALAKRQEPCGSLGGPCTPGESYLPCCGDLTCQPIDTWTGKCV